MKLYGRVKLQLHVFILLHSLEVHGHLMLVPPYSRDKSSWYPFNRRWVCPWASVILRRREKVFFLPGIKPCFLPPLPLSLIEIIWDPVVYSMHWLYLSLMNIVLKMVWKTDICCHSRILIIIYYCSVFDIINHLFYCENWNTVGCLLLK